jgi:tetratricopeptide (TPR) repeat protein
MDSVLILTNIALSFDNHLAEAYTITGNYYLQTGKPELAIKEYDKAIRFNPNSYEAYYEKGNLYVSEDLLKCIENLEKAASINRGSELPAIFESLSWAYYCAGFIEKNNYCIEKALKLDRDSVSYYRLLARSKFWIGDYNKSIDLYQNAYSIDSTTDLSYLAFSYSMIGKYKESLRYFKKWDEFNQSRGIISFNLTHRIGYVYWQNGYRKEADYYFDKQIEYCDGMIKAERPWAQKYYAFYDLAGVYAFRGEREKAYKNLKIFNQRPSIPLWMERLIKSDPLFDSIRDEQEFREIVQDVEAKYQSEHERVRKWLEEQGKL